MTVAGGSGDGCAGIGRLRNLSGLWVTTMLVVVAAAAKAAGLLATVVMVSAAVAVERKTVAGALTTAEL